MRRFISNMLRKLAIKIYPDSIYSGPIYRIEGAIEKAQADDYVIMIFRGVDKNNPFDKSFDKLYNSEDYTIIGTFI